MSKSYFQFKKSSFHKYIERFITTCKGFSCNKTHNRPFTAFLYNFLTDTHTSTSSSCHYSCPAQSVLCFVFVAAIGWSVQLTWSILRDKVVMTCGYSGWFGRQQNHKQQTGTEPSKLGQQEIFPLSFSVSWEHFLLLWYFCCAFR